MFQEYASYDAIGLATLIRQGEVSPKEVLEAAVLKAESTNPALNAIVSALYDHAHERIDTGALSGPLAYVPFLLKDVHHALKGTPMSNGSALQKGERSRANAEIVERWLAAGLVVFGKTNTPEFKLSPTTNPAVWGPTRNPWDVVRTPGGSSGGSAAAVAAGIAPLASATDEAGSIRQPAANCGVFGLKPSRGRNPIGPDFRWELAGLSTSHVITRSVRDSAAALDATSGPEVGAPYHCPAPGGFLEALSEPSRKLRVGLCVERQVFGREMDQACIDAVTKAGALLEQLGHEVEEVATPFDEREAMRLCMIRIAVSFSGFAEHLVERYGRGAVLRGFEPLTRFVWSAGKVIPSAMFEGTRVREHDITQSMARFHERYDTLVTPTLGCAPKLIEEADPTAADVRLAGLLASPLVRPVMRLPRVIDRLIDVQVEAMVDRVPYRTSLANLTGQPAMSVPLHWTENALPVGVQFLGRFGSERMLLQLAGQLEVAQPWVDRLPIHAR